MEDTIKKPLFRPHDPPPLAIVSRILDREGALRRAITSRLPDWCVLVWRWRRARGAFPNIFHPVMFNEKLLRRMIFDHRALYTQLADKAAVRSYVEQRLGSDILPKLYYATDRPETIPFERLPEKFVVKATHGSGWVELVPDKSRLDRAALLRPATTG